jgi:hypothetical protein
VCVCISVLKVFQMSTHTHTTDGIFLKMHAPIPLMTNFQIPPPPHHPLLHQIKCFCVHERS